MDDGLAKDLVAMWQSELTAMAADRELREGWTALLALWSGITIAASRAHDHASGSAGTAKPAGPPPAAPASDAGLDEIERLGRRVRELEQRLAEFDQSSHRPQQQPPRKRPRRHPRRGNA